MGNRTNATISKATHRRLAQIAKINRRSIAEQIDFWVARAIEDWQREIDAYRQAEQEQKPLMTDEECEKIFGKEKKAAE